MVFFIACKSNRYGKHTLGYKEKETDAYLQLLAKHPDSAGLRLIVINKLDSIGRYTESLREIDTLLSADSNKYAFWVVKGNVLLNSTDTMAAVRSYERAIRIFPGNEALLSLAEIMANAKNDSCLLLAKRFTGNRAYADYINGLHAAGLGDTAGAFELLDKCIAEDPQFVKPYLVKAQLYGMAMEWQRAMEVLQEALPATADNTALLNAVANCFVQLKNTDSARAYYTRSLSVQPFQPGITERISKLNKK